MGLFGGRSQSSSGTVVVAKSTHLIAPYHAAQPTVRSNRALEEREPQSTGAAAEVAKPLKRGSPLMRRSAIRGSVGHVDTSAGRFEAGKRVYRPASQKRMLEKHEGPLNQELLPVHRVDHTQQ